MHRNTPYTHNYFGLQTRGLPPGFFYVQRSLMKHIVLSLFVCTTAHAVTPTVAMTQAARARLKTLAQWQEEHDRKVMKTFKLSPRDKLRAHAFNHGLKDVYLTPPPGQTQKPTPQASTGSQHNITSQSTQREWQATRAE